MKKSESVVFLDRDGVINKSPSPSKRYIQKWSEFQFLPGVLPGLRRLHEAGKRVVVVSNQAGVARGVLKNSNLQEITDNMKKAVASAGGHLDAVYICRHHPDAGCGCRKPRTGLAQRAKRRFKINPKRSFLVGDNCTDIALGARIGVKTILVLTGMSSRSDAKRMQPAPDYIETNFKQAIDRILL